MNYYLCLEQSNKKRDIDKANKINGFAAVAKKSYEFSANKKMAISSFVKMYGKDWAVEY